MGVLEIIIMTKKHYKIIAACFKQAYKEAKGSPEAIVVICNLIENVSNCFQNDNDNFNKDKFQIACGL